MVELNTSCTIFQIPYTTNVALDDYAEAVIQDFSPSLLHSLGKFDICKFIECYLQLNIAFHRITFDQKILGLTVFKDGMIEVFDDIKWKPSQTYVTRGTVVIDKSLLTGSSKPRLRFTMAHEAAHWLLHRKSFSTDNPCGSAGILENKYLAAKTGKGDYLRSAKARNDIERMERQADFFASALLMPRPALRVAIRDFFKLNEVNENPWRIVRGASQKDDRLAAYLPEYIAQTFGVSKKAATIRLEKLTVIT